METEKVRTRRRRRNKYRMRLDLLDAVRRILKEKGYIYLDIQTICEFADVDRNAIYRHFESLENLLTKFVESKEYLKDSFKINTEEKIDDQKVFLKKILFDQHNLFGKDRELQQILVWELAELSLRTKLISQQREDMYKDFLLQYEKQFEKSGIDFNSIIAIIIAGMYYLVIHKKHSAFCQVDFAKERDRMLGAINEMVEMLFEAKEKKEQTLEFATNALENGVDEQTVCKIFGLKPEIVETLKS